MAESSATGAQTERTAPNRALKRLEALVGKWDWKGRSESGTFKATGWTTFEWLEGGFFLVERWRLSAGPGENTGIAIAGYDDPHQTCVAHYFDNEGRFDTYEIDLRDRSLKITWALYRFDGTLSTDGNTISGTWEQSSDGSCWEYWYDLEMTKID
jgi:hypothetical protein